MVSASDLASRFACPLVAAGIFASSAATAPLSTTALVTGIGGAVFGLVAGALASRPAVRTRASAIAATVTVTAAGQTHVSAAYPALVCVFAIVLLACLRAGRRSEGQRFALDPARSRPLPRAVLAVHGAAFAAVAAALVVTIPPLGAMVEARIVRLIGGSMGRTTGFSSTLRLGSMAGMLQSDVVVMRIEGAQPEYLRGAVYDHYEARMWTSTEGDAHRRSVVADARKAHSATRITIARETSFVRREARWFLPANACALGTPPGRVAIDDNAVAHPEPATAPTAIWYSTEACTPEAPVAARRADLDVPSRLRPTLDAIATEWTLGAGTDREKLRAIEEHLRTFQYVIDAARETHADPIVHFLTEDRRGHCELFASSFALLARTRGIPTRVVTGYHVGESNALGGYAVVRERNAHAWVEAWVDGRWRAWDPTPVADGVGPRPGRMEQLVDWLGWKLGGLWTDLADRSLFEIGGALTVVVLVLLFVRWFLARLRARREDAEMLAGDRPLPSFGALESALANRGHTRDAAEPIERFARRVAALSDPWAADVAAAIADYAALRYGNVGREPAVAHALGEARAAVEANRGRPLDGASA